MHLLNSSYKNIFIEIRFKLKMLNKKFKIKCEQSYKKMVLSLQIMQLFNVSVLKNRIEKLTIYYLNLSLHLPK